MPVMSAVFTAPARSGPRAAPRRPARGSRPRGCRRPRARSHGGASRAAGGSLRPSEPQALGLAPLGAHLEGHGPGEDAHRLLLAPVVLEAQRLARAHGEDLDDIAVGARPDDLVPPRLGDVLGTDRARGSPAAHRSRISQASRYALFTSVIISCRARPAPPGRRPAAASARA